MNDSSLDSVQAFEPTITRARFSLLARLVLGCVAGFAAGMAVTLFSPLATAEPAWMAEAITSLVAAAVWMMVGLYAARTHASRLAPVLFLLGAGTAWMLARGIVHSVSPYYGLFSFGSACVGASVAWSIHQRRERVRFVRAIAVFLPFTVLLLGFLTALLRPSLGITRSVVTADSVRKRLSLAPVDPSKGDQWYVWSDRRVTLVAGSDSTVLMETDPGSGNGRYRVTETGDPRHVRSACSAFRVHAANAINDEILRGSIPTFMRALPLRYPRCEQGRIWIAEPTFGGVRSM